ncbi:sigma factor-like helix-turn-helix DNA-binding protein [Sorangium sp. So ce1128]
MSGREPAAGRERGLRQLAEHESAVIMAHDVYEMSMDDVAEQQDAPRSTAYKWRARGIAALARALRPRRG